MSTQKITVYLPVEKITKGVWSTYKSAPFEVEPVKYERWACGSTGASANRYYYQVAFPPPPGMLDGAKDARNDGLVRANINRKQNPKWKPPREGWERNVYVVDREAGQ